jgi:predicted secreted hydrolase
MRGIGRSKIAGAFILIAMFIGLLLAWRQSGTQPPAAATQPAFQLILERPVAAPTFETALFPRTFDLPGDHGPHLGFQTEWWYYTGNLEADDGEHFGYQLTFFRRGLTPGVPERPSPLATNQIYFAHFAITDVLHRQHVSEQRFSRGADGLAGAQSDPYSVWLETWNVRALNADGSRVRLVAQGAGLSFDLTLQSTKPLVLEGDEGLSAKSAQPGNASYYLSYTRMATAGQLVSSGRTYQVTGLSWFDHEWSTSALGPEAVGWDWFSLQLNDGRELMLFQIRRKDGTLEPASSATLVERNGMTQRLDSADFSIEATATWHSQASGGDYPSRWRVTIPGEGLDLLLTPWLPDQENRLDFNYWEGAVRISGRGPAGDLSGNGYVELTGYAGSMQGIF